MFSHTEIGVAGYIVECKWVFSLNENMLINELKPPEHRVTTGPGREQADITGRLYQAACRPPVYSFLESFDCFHRGDSMKKKNFEKKNLKLFSKT